MTKEMNVNKVKIVNIESQSTCYIILNCSFIA